MDLTRVSDVKLTRLKNAANFSPSRYTTFSCEMCISKSEVVSKLLICDSSMWELDERPQFEAFHSEIYFVRIYIAFQILDGLNRRSRDTKLLHSTSVVPALSFGIHWWSRSLPVFNLDLENQNSGLKTNTNNIVILDLKRLNS